MAATVHAAGGTDLSMIVLEIGRSAGELLERGEEERACKRQLVWVRERDEGRDVSMYSLRKGRERETGQQVYITDESGQALNNRRNPRGWMDLRKGKGERAGTGGDGHRRSRVRDDLRCARFGRRRRIARRRVAVRRMLVVRLARRIVSRRRVLPCIVMYIDGMRLRIGVVEERLLRKGRGVVGGVGGVRVRRRHARRRVAHRARAVRRPGLLLLDGRELLRLQPGVRDERRRRLFFVVRRRMNVSDDGVMQVGWIGRRRRGRDEAGSDCADRRELVRRVRCSEGARGRIVIRLIGRRRGGIVAVRRASLCREEGAGGGRRHGRRVPGVEGGRLLLERAVREMHMGRDRSDGRSARDRPRRRVDRAPLRLESVPGGQLVLLEAELRRVHVRLLLVLVLVQLKGAVLGRRRAVAIVLLQTGPGGRRRRVFALLGGLARAQLALDQGGFRRVVADKVARRVPARESWRWSGLGARRERRWAIRANAREDDERGDARATLGRTTPVG